MKRPLPLRKMLVRMQNPYEEGSVLLDALQHDTMDELVELARDKEWQGTGNAIYCLCKTIDYSSTREIVSQSEPRRRKTQYHQPALCAAKCAPPRRASRSWSSLRT